MTPASGPIFVTLYSTVNRRRVSIDIEPLLHLLDDHLFEYLVRDGADITGRPEAELLISQAADVPGTRAVSVFKAALQGHALTFARLSLPDNRTRIRRWLRQWRPHLDLKFFRIECRCCHQPATAIDGLCDAHRGVFPLPQGDML